MATLKMRQVHVHPADRKDGNEQGPQQPAAAATPQQRRRASEVTCWVAHWENPLEQHQQQQQQQPASAPAEGFAAASQRGGGGGDDHDGGVRRRGFAGRCVVVDVEAGVGAAAGLGPGQEMMAVAAGSRVVDLRMVGDIWWLAPIVHCFSVLAGERPVGAWCPCRRALQRALRLTPWLTFAFYLWALVLHVSGHVVGSLRNSVVGGAIWYVSTLVFCVAQAMGVRVICEPANRYVLRLVELRARSDLELSSAESNVGPTSLTRNTGRFAILFVLGLLAQFAGRATGEWGALFSVAGIFSALLNCAVIGGMASAIISFQRWVVCIGGQCAFPHNAEIRTPGPRSANQPEHAHFVHVPRFPSRPRAVVEEAGGSRRRDR